MVDLGPVVAISMLYIHQHIEITTAPDVFQDVFILYTGVTHMHEHARRTLPQDGDKCASFECRCRIFYDYHWSDIFAEVMISS